MADRIKGITLEIGGDTTNLSKALSGVNSDINSTKRQLKDVERLLKLDPTNVELLRQKEQLLNREIGSTKDKVEQLKQAQQTMDATGVDKNSEQYMALQREIISTETELKNLEEATRNFGSVAAQELAAVGKKVEAVGGKISAAGDKISGVGTKFLPATAAVTGLGAVAVNAASDMAESENKVEVAFGDASDRVMAFADTTLDAYGISQGTALDMASLFGDMATSMDLSVDTAAAMSEQLVGLSGDLASFKNIGVDQAAQALKGIFTGETESLKSLGVVMTQDTLLQYAMEKGMIDSAKSATQLQKEQIALEKAQKAYTSAVEKHGASSLEARDAELKVTEAREKMNESVKATLDSLSREEMVMLRYNYVMDATKNAQGDFARTSDGYANSMRVMQESTKEAAAAFGELLLPIITPIIQKITEIIKVVTNLDDTHKRIILTIMAIVAATGPVLIVIGSIISGVGSIITGVGGVIKAIGSFASIVPNIVSGFGVLSKAVMAFNAACAANPYLVIAVAIVAAVSLITYAIISNFDTIKAAFQGMLEWLQSGFQSFCQFLEQLDYALGAALIAVINGLVSAVKGLLNAGIYMVEGFVNAVLGMLNALIGAINSVCGAVAGVFGGSFSGIQKFNSVNLPKLAKGGTVYDGSVMVGDAGPEILTVTGGHAVVTPLTGSQRAAGAAAAAGTTAFRTEVGVSFNGSLSQLAAVLQPYIVAETKRIGGSFTG